MKDAARRETVRDRLKKLEAAYRQMQLLVEKLESQLRQAQKMESLGRLAGGVAHDFNNLLTIITGTCEILLSGGFVEKEARRHVEEIKLASEQGAALSRRLLAFNRRQPAHARPMNLNRAVADMDKVLRRTLGTDIDLITLLDLKIGDVLADPAQIEQVILNLATNARDAMPSGGRLTIETKHGEVAGRGPVTPGRYVLLCVTDTGAGVDGRALSRLLDPDLGPDEEDVRALSLSMVSAAVREMGGFIDAQSASGRGTTFRVYLRPHEAPSGAARAEGGERRQGSETILLVEDQAMVRKLAREALRSRGYTVLEASDGEDARQIAGHHRGPLHLVIADVIIPGGSGTALVQHLTALRPGLKSLYISGHADTARHGELRPFLQKPFTPASLAAKVREVLDERS